MNLSLMQGVISGLRVKGMEAALAPQSRAVLRHVPAHVSYVSLLTRTASLYHKDMLA